MAGSSPAAPPPSATSGSGAACGGVATATGLGAGWTGCVPEDGGGGEGGGGAGGAEARGAPAGGMVTADLQRGQGAVPPPGGRRSARRRSSVPQIWHWISSTVTAAGAAEEGPG